MNKTRYHDMLREDIKEFVSFSSFWKLEDMIARTREREINLENLSKKKEEQVQKAKASAKKPKTFDLRARGQQGRSHCGKSIKQHDMAC